MKTRILRLAEMSSEEMSLLKRRAELNIEGALSLAREVIDQIKHRGDSALIE